MIGCDSEKPLVARNSGSSSLERGQQTAWTKYSWWLFLLFHWSTVMPFGYNLCGCFHSTKSRAKWLPQRIFTNWPFIE